MSMQNPVKERIAKLRDEIAQISEVNRLYLKTRKEATRRSGGSTNVGFKGCRKSWTNWWRLTDWKKL